MYINQISNKSSVKIDHKYRGHSMELVRGEWVYSDTKESVEFTCESRACGSCNKLITSEGHDACLGALEGTMNACCGYGDITEAYVQFLDGFCIRGKDAKTVLDILKKWSNKEKDNAST